MRCFFGFHKWGKWEVYQRGKADGWPCIIQKRTCGCCGETQLRSVYL